MISYFAPYFKVVCCNYFSGRHMISMSNSKDGLCSSRTVVTLYMKHVCPYSVIDSQPICSLEKCTTRRMIGSKSCLLGTDSWRTQSFGRLIEKTQRGHRNSSSRYCFTIRKVSTLGHEAICSEVVIST